MIPRSANQLLRALGAAVVLGGAAACSVGNVVEPNRPADQPRVIGRSFGAAQELFDPSPSGALGSSVGADPSPSAGESQSVDSSLSLDASQGPDASPAAASMAPPSGSGQPSSEPSSAAGPPSPAIVTPASAPLDAYTATRLQRVLDKTAKRTGVAGMSAAVLLDDGRTWAGVTGDRIVKSDTPVDRDTVFAIASITKTFVTAVVMQLVAEGKLNLDDRLDQWVPRIQGAHKITIAELLGHTSGVYNYFENPRYNSRVFSDPKHHWTFDEIMELVGSPYCKPGACYHYSNTNFVLLGKIVEVVTGHPLAEEIANRLTTPLSLGATGLQPDHPAPDDRAHGYLGDTDWTRKSKLLPNVSAATVANAAGAMISTALDLARWSHALYGGDVVPAPELDEMLTFRKCDDNYGLGTRKLIINGRIAYGHLGSLRGYMNAMWTFPREGATVVILSNQGNWNLDGAVRKFTQALWDGIDAAPPQYDPSKNTTNHDGVTLYC